MNVAVSTNSTELSANSSTATLVDAAERLIEMSWEYEQNWPHRVTSDTSGIPGCSPTRWSGSTRLRYWR